MHDIWGKVIAESDGTGVAGTVREYIWIPDAGYAGVSLPLAVVDGVNTASPALYYVHTDHLSRPIMMTDTTKVQVWSAIWSPFGQAHSITGTLTEDRRFPGQWFQLESGLHYNWHRHYDPTIGRYTSADPLGFVDGPSIYSYAQGNPIGGVDPDGRFRVTPRAPGTLPRPVVPRTPNIPNGEAPNMGPQADGPDNPNNYNWEVPPINGFSLPPHPDEFPTQPGGGRGNHCKRVEAFCLAACGLLVLQHDFKFKKQSRKDNHSACRRRCHRYFKCPPPGASYAGMCPVRF